MSASLLFVQAEAPVGIQVSVQNAGGAELASGSDSKTLTVNYPAPYQKGDTVVVAGSKGASFFVQMDSAVPEALIYAPTGRMTYPIPFAQERKDGYDPAAFGKGTQAIKVRLATSAELAAYRNLSLNALDKRGQTEYYPHANANSVTRNDPKFYERNAIDGNLQNNHHGSWPYESWGPDKNPDAALKIEFGREVLVDKARIVLRADFPHDSYWKSLNLRFSDGSTVEVALEKKGEAQEITFPKKKVSWVQLENMQQGITPLGWAALTEIEVYGSDVIAH